MLEKIPAGSRVTLKVALGIRIRGLEAVGIRNPMFGVDDLANVVCEVTGLAVRATAAALDGHSKGEEHQLSTSGSFFSVSTSHSPESDLLALSSK